MAKVGEGVGGGGGVKVNLPVRVRSNLFDGSLPPGEEDLGVGDVEEVVLHVHGRRRVLPRLKHLTLLRQGDLLVGESKGVRTGDQILSVV